MAHVEPAALLPFSVRRMVPLLPTAQPLVGASEAHGSEVLRDARRLGRPGSAAVQRAQNDAAVANYPALLRGHEVDAPECLGSGRGLGRPGGAAVRRVTDEPAGADHPAVARVGEVDAVQRRRGARGLLGPGVVGGGARHARRNRGGRHKDEQQGQSRKTPRRRIRSSALHRHIISGSVQGCAGRVLGGPSWRRAVLWSPAPY